MKCSLCQKTSCICEKDIVLPMKSTLSNSVTEFPNHNQIKKSIVSHKNAPKQNSMFLSDSVPQKFSFDSKKDKFFDTSRSKKSFRDESSVQISSSFPQKSNKIQGAKPKPFLPFQE